MRRCVPQLRGRAQDPPQSGHTEDSTRTTCRPSRSAQTRKSRRSPAIRTDFILSGEIMVIALKDVIDEGFVSRAVILVIVAIVIPRWCTGWWR
ncbi:MAG: DUF808 family protein [Ilumatobacteraceae bacterium]